MKHSKSSFTSGLRNRVNIAASIAAAFLTLQAGAASAQNYVPQPQLTPYQIVSASGKCLAAAGIDVVRPVTCDTASNAQKFYVLDYSSVSNEIPILDPTMGRPTDFVPQTDADTDRDSNPLRTGNALLVLASAWDNTLSKDATKYSLLAAEPRGTNGSYPILFPTDSGGGTLGGSEWIYTRHWYIKHQQWKRLATENGIVKVSDAGTGSIKRLRYGAEGSWKYRDAQTGQFLTCNDANFGGNPAIGKPKSCYQWVGSHDDTPLRVTIQANFGGYSDGDADYLRCLGFTPDFPPPEARPGFAALRDCSDPSTVWTLQPTTYPK